MGPDHPDVAKTLYNLAQLYLRQRRYTQAEPLYQQAMAIQEKSLTSDHPDLAATLNGFAQLLRETKRKSQAEAMTRRARSMVDKSRTKTAATQTVDVRDLNSEAKVSRRSF